MASQIIFPCSKQPAIPRTLLFSTEVLIYSLMRRYLVNLDAKTAKNIFPSTLWREIGPKWPMFFEFFSLGMYIPSAIIHLLLTWKFFYARFKLAWSYLRTLGHFYIREKVFHSDQVWIYSYFCWLYALFLRVEPHLGDGWPNQIVMFQREMSIGIKAYILNVFPELFSLYWARLICSSYICMVPWKNVLALSFVSPVSSSDFLPCEEHCVFLWGFCQILSRPSLSSTLAKRISFLNFFSSFWDPASFFNVCSFWLVTY